MKHLKIRSIDFESKEIVRDREKIVLTPSHIKAYMIMMLQGLEYLHNNWILHRVSVVIIYHRFLYNLF